MRWRLEKEFRFEAAHQLPDHHGKCARLHGHSWRGALICEGDELQQEGSSAGMLVDYGEMSAAVKPLVENYLDHFFLNDSLDLEAPTSEVIAQWIYRRIKPALPALAAVRIEETCTSACIYSEAHSPNG